METPVGALGSARAGSRTVRARLGEHSLRLFVLAACVWLSGALVLPSMAASASPAGVERVVIVTLPGVTWNDIIEARTPAIDGLIDEGSAAAMAVRGATGVSTPERGYLTLGAGNRGFITIGDPAGNLSFRSDAMFGETTAREALAQRVDHVRRGEIVHLGVPGIQKAQTARRFGTFVGAFGEALARSGIARAVVSAADLDPDPTPADRRRASVLGIVDEQGTVDDGTLDGLVVADPRAPFGARTDGDALLGAVSRALGEARVILVEPGEVTRADEFVGEAEDAVANRHRREALERSDAMIGDIHSLLGPADVMMVAAVSRATSTPGERLMPLIAVGPGFDGGLLTSGTTRHPGMVALLDVAPTVLNLFGVDRPSSMSDTPFSAVASDEENIAGALAEINDRAMFREVFSGPVYTVYVGLTIIVAALAAVAFLARRYALIPVMHWIALGILAIPPAVIVIRALEVRRLGLALAHLVLWSLVVALAGAARMVRGPKWAGAVALLCLSVLLYGGDLAAGAQFQSAGVFGNSPIVAGRFYGATNAGFSIVYAAGTLGLLGLLDLLGYKRLPVWAGGGLVVLVLLIGLPPFGANFGGLVTAVVAVSVAYVLGRHGRIRWRTLLGGGVGAAAVAAVVSLIDMTRPLENQTHFGRFASSVIEDGLPALWLTIERKSAASFGTLDYSGWTYLIPVVGILVAVLLHRPRGVLRDVVVERPLLRSALWGILVAGVVGFAVNDSGVVVPGVMVAHAIPLMVLMGSDAVARAEVDRRPVEGGLAER